MTMKKAVKRMISAAAMAVWTLLAPAGMTAQEAAPIAMEHGSDSVTRPSGKYIFIPDSLERDVIQLLRGHSRVVYDNLNRDENEMGLHKGDTIPLVMPSRNLGRYDRGLSALLYVPKGEWSFGLTVSYGSISTDQLEIFDLLSDVNIGAHAFSINPYLQYAVRNNITVGMRFKYYTARGAVDSFKVDIDDDMNFNLKDIVYEAESYGAAIFGSQYIGLSRHGRFGIYNEVELAFSSGQSDFQRPIGGEPRNTHTTWMEGQLNFSPGVQMYIMKNVSFHISFGVFGFNLRHEKQSEDGVNTGNRTVSGANFRFNIFNLNFGIGIHI